MTRRSWPWLLAATIALAEPAHAAGPRDEARPTFYWYQGRPQPLELQPNRLAVQLASPAAEAGLEAGMAAAGISIMSVSPTGLSGWRLLELSPEEATPGPDPVALVAARLDAVEAIAGVEFASPVFAGRDGGWIAASPEILVRLRSSAGPAPEQLLAALAPDAGILEREFGGLPGAYRMESRARDGFAVLALANRLAEDPRVAWAEPDMQFSARHGGGAAPMQAALIPNDPDFGNAWGIHNTGQFGGTPGVDMGGVEAWDVTTGSADIKVLILDVGVQLDHPDLHVAGGADFTGEATGGYPGNGCDNHGTAVAGCVSAVLDNAYGTVGIAPGCPLLAARIGVSDPSCSGFFSTASSWTVYALAWGFVRGARVSNNSNWYGFSSNAIDDAYASTLAGGMLHFASAGNGGPAPLGYPASLPSVIAVAALQPSGQLAPFSNYGLDIPLCGPGTLVYTTDRTGPYGWVSGDFVFAGGTSFSSPYAAGVAALLFSQNPSRSASEVRALLESGARDLGAPGFDPFYGYGLVNARNSLTLGQGAADVAAGGPSVPARLSAAPNPFAGGVTLRFGLTAAGPTSVEIFDAGGRRVRALAAGARAAGPHSVTWDGRDETGRPTPAGIYFARLHTARGSISRRLIRLEAGAR